MVGPQGKVESLGLHMAAFKNKLVIITLGCMSTIQYNEDLNNAQLLTYFLSETVGLHKINIF